MNVIEQLECKLAYYDAAVRHVSHYITTTFPVYSLRKSGLLQNTCFVTSNCLRHLFFLWWSHLYSNHIFGSNYFFSKSCFSIAYWKRMYPFIWMVVFLSCADFNQSNLKAVVLSLYNCNHHFLNLQLHIIALYNHFSLHTYIDTLWTNVNM